MGVLQRNETELFIETVVACDRVMTLSFHGDCLVDWAGGMVAFIWTARWNEVDTPHTGQRFDAVTAAPDGSHVAIYERLGTKALLLHNGRLVRELNRSYYCADAYEYPITFLKLPDGRTGLVHCPDHYNQLEIEDALTGERLTLGDREPADFFHSRLAASPGGKYLLSAGWVWHPWDAVVFFDVACALTEPRRLDRANGMPHGLHVGLAEEASAAFLDDEHVVITGSDEAEDPEEAGEAPGPRLRTRGLAVFEVSAGKCLSSVQLPEPAGTVMPVGPCHVLSLLREPKLIEIATGTVLHRWKGLFTGMQTSSITHHLTDAIPPMALDSRKSRFAVASEGSVHIVQFKLPGEHHPCEGSGGIGMR